VACAKEVLGALVEIKVGIQQAARELSVESKMSADEVEKELLKALAEKAVLTLTDENGRKVIVPADKVAYLDLGQENARRVGFGSV
jgi:hypothetical protein